MRAAFAFLFILAVVSLCYAQSTSCPTCDELTGRPQAQLTTLVNDNRTVQVIGFYENISMKPSRQPLNNTVLILQVAPLTGLSGTDLLYRIYTDANGTAIYDFNSLYISGALSTGVLQTKCVNFRVIYCPFCLPESSSCGFDACMNYSRISTFKSDYSNLGGIGQITAAADIPAASAVPSPVNGEKYLPQMAPASYCPPPISLTSTPALCLPLILIFSLLSGALYVTGRNPFAGFNLGGARTGRHMRYQARGRGVSVSAESVSYAVSSGVQVGKTLAAGAKEGGGVKGALKVVGEGLKTDAKRAGILYSADFRRVGFGVGSVGAAIKGAKAAAADKKGFAAKLGAGMGAFSRHLGATAASKKDAFEAKIAAKAAGKEGAAAPPGRTVVTPQGLQQSGPSGRVVDASSILYKSSLPGWKGAFVSLGMSILKIGGLALQQSRLGQLVEMVRSTYGMVAGKPYETLMSKWLIDQKKEMNSATQTLMEMGKNNEVSINGKKATMTVTKEGNYSIVTFTSVTKGESLGTIAGGKVEIKEIKIVLAKDASGNLNFVQSTASVTNTAGQQIGISIVQTDSQKPQIINTQTGQVLKPGESTVIDGKKVTVSAFAGLVDNCMKNYNDNVTVLTSLCKSIEMAAHTEMAKTGKLEPVFSIDDRLNAAIKKDPELQKKVEALRGTAAEQVLAIAGIRPEALSTVTAPSGVPATPQNATAAAVTIVTRALDGSALLTAPASGAVSVLKLPEGDKDIVQAAIGGIVSGRSLHQLSSMDGETLKASLIGTIFVNLKASGMAPAAAENKAERMVDAMGASGIKTIATNLTKNADALITKMSDGIPAGVAQTLSNAPVSNLSGMVKFDKETAHVSESFTNPAPLLASDPKSLELGGKVGDLIREREQLVTEAYQASKLQKLLSDGAPSSEITERINTVRQDFVRFAETSLVDEARGEKAWKKAVEQNVISDPLVQDNLIKTAQLSRWERQTDDLPSTAPLPSTLKQVDVENFANEQALKKETIKSYIQTGGAEGYAAAAEEAAAAADKFGSTGNWAGKTAYENLAKSLNNLAQAYTAETEAAKTDPKRGVSADVAQQLQQTYLFQVDAMPDAKRLIQYEQMPAYELESYENLAKKISYYHPVGATTQDAAGTFAGETNRFRSEVQEAKALLASAQTDAERQSAQANLKAKEGAAANWESITAKLNAMPPGTDLNSAIAIFTANADHLNSAAQEARTRLDAAKTEAETKAAEAQLNSMGTAAMVWQEATNKLKEMKPDLNGAIGLCTEHINYYRALGDDEAAKKWETGRQEFMDLSRGISEGKPLPKPDTPEGKQAYIDGYQKACGNAWEAIGSTLDQAIVDSHQKRMEDVERLKWEVAFTQEQLHHGVAAAFKESDYYNKNIAKSQERTTGEGTLPPEEQKKPKKKMGGIDIAPSAPRGEENA